MKKTILVFSGIAIALLVLFKLSEFALLSGSNAQYYIAIIALVFLSIGLYLNKKNTRTTTVNPLAQLQKLGITNREFEVLQKVAQGYSNKEIANQLSLTESTIKTHVSNLLLKLDAKRRTQAIERAKSLKIIS